MTITSKTRSFTKAHARRLEYDCIRTAQDAQRFRLQNTQTPAEPHIPEAMLAELRDNFGTIQTLLSILGFPILDPLPTEENTKRQRTTRLYCRGHGAEAVGEYTEDGLVVFNGSTARLDTTASVPDAVTRRRQALLEDGVLDQEEDHLIFRENHPFNSPSAAAGVVLGNSSNGWREWADENGRTLDQIERQ